VGKVEDHQDNTRFKKEGRKRKGLVTRFGGHDSTRREKVRGPLEEKKLKRGWNERRKKEVVTEGER